MENAPFGAGYNPEGKGGKERSTNKTKRGRRTRSAQVGTTDTKYTKGHKESEHQVSGTKWSRNGRKGRNSMLENKREEKSNGQRSMLMQPRLN